MNQPSAGHSGDIPGDPGLNPAHIIYFCDQCGFRIPPLDLARGGKARLLEDNRATCANCSRKRSGATGALRQTDGTGRRSTRSVPVATRTSQHSIVPVTHGEHGALSAHTSGRAVKKPNIWIPVGLGGALVLVIVVGVLVVGRSKPPGPVAEVKPQQTLPSSPLPTTERAATRTEVKPEPKVETKIDPEPAKSATTNTGNGGDDYDPRAAVAESLLVQAKAYFQANPEDPYEYKAKLENLKATYARTKAGDEADRLLSELKTLPPIPDQLDEIPEAKEYRLVYDLNLNKLNASITYDKDERARIAQPFDRIAYLLELKPANGGKQWVYVSMDAFTDDLGKIGIPTVSSGASFQQNVTNMNVYSNVPGVVTGTGLAGGNIEFWPNNYGNRNKAEVPNAVSERYDFGDEMASQPVDGHGSMQVHDHEAKQTLFALNKWRAGGGADLGIGTRPTGEPDWTFAANAHSYKAKRLRVLVRLK